MPSKADCKKICTVYAVAKENKNRFRIFIPFDRTIKMEREIIPSFMSVV